MGSLAHSLEIPYRGVYLTDVTLDKWIVLVVAIGAIIWLNVNFIRRMNRRRPRDKQDLK